jgi:hypothetical protein
MTCFKYQVYLYGEINMTFLKPILYTVTEPSQPSTVRNVMPTKPPPLPPGSPGSPPPLYMASVPLPFGREKKITWFNFYLFKKRKKRFVEEPSISPNHVCEIGLN